MRRPGRRRAWIACLSSGLLCLAAAGVGLGIGAGPARADDGPGSGFGSFSLLATAPGTQWTYDFPTANGHPQFEAEVPHSVAQLQSGPQGYGLATLAWPGALAGNAGTTSQLVNLPVPPDYAGNLNDPVRAEARTGTGPPTVTNNPYPGLVM